MIGISWLNDRISITTIWIVYSCIPPVYTIAVCDKVSATSIIEDYENRLTTYQNYKKINLNEIVSKDVMLNISEVNTRLCPSKTVFVYWTVKETLLDCLLLNKGKVTKVICSYFLVINNHAIHSPYHACLLLLSFYYVIVNHRDD